MVKDSSDRVNLQKEEVKSMSAVASNSEALPVPGREPRQRPGVAELATSGNSGRRGQ